MVALRRRLAPTNNTRLVRAYHQVLVWDIEGLPVVSHVTRAADAALNPFIGKSMVVYATRQVSAA